MSSPNNQTFLRESGVHWQHYQCFERSLTTRVTSGRDLHGVRFLSMTGFSHFTDIGMHLRTISI